MGPDTPVAFSLPSQPPGEVDAAGLCTIVILRRLEAAHNDLLGRFRTLLSQASSVMTVSSPLSASTAPAAAATMIEEGEDRHQDGDQNKEEEREEDEDQVVPLAPALSYRTLPSLARRALLSYDRKRDLLPLLSRFFHRQPLGDINGNGAADFDGPSLERELARVLR
jgi:hypothetical protein